ncbi:cytochrome b N-terminal domain-containing protein [Leptolyngbya sp. NIES-2104]|uniref:cytochrome b N-terminal domain-containing protein n=1 Tax=Leptolyngbya sp. NIES-2104 TaxID=1552121 RepID=UPI0006EC7E6D|nr:cytochrome b N-terminal domain-containing protein [Leptolyngbya sp. NIES-2104]GAP98820.1 cytochrome b6-f complex subunit, cytochrome b6, putative [Leptolyngbya sp. NIES-2104]
MLNPAFILRRLSTVLAVSILTLTLVAATSGILIAFYYIPTAGGAYDSLQQIDTEVPYGWLVHTLHNLSGNFVIVLGLVQIVVMFLGERFRRSWLTAWISGIFFTLSAIGLSWTAMILNWNQLGFWRLKIELGTIEAIPFIGATLRDIITGGSVGTLTVAHLYTLHSYVVSLAALGLSIVHLGALLFQEKEMQAEKVATPVVKPVPQPEIEQQPALATDSEVQSPI